MEQLELKTRVWELQQDVLALKEVKPSPPKEGPPATPAPIASMPLVAVDKTPTLSAASTSKPVASAPATKTQPPKMS